MCIALHVIRVEFRPWDIRMTMLKICVRYLQLARGEIPKGCGQTNCNSADGVYLISGSSLSHDRFPVKAAVDHKWFCSASIFD